MPAPNEIIERHKRQLAVMRGWLNGRRYYKAARALEFVASLEKGFRKDGVTPSFHHQLSVARLVTTLAPHLIHTEETIAAAFLHDTIEDHASVSVATLASEYGSLTAEAVERLSKKNKATGSVKSYDDYFAGLASCPIGSLVKLADRIHNVHSMVGVFTVEKQKKYLSEVDEWFFPLAKAARRLHPEQADAYENLKIMLRSQSALIREIHSAMEEGI